MTAHRKTILWLDDDFIYDPGRLSIWKRALDQQHQWLKVIEAGTLDNFVAILKERSERKQGAEDSIDALILDVMMKAPSHGATFEKLGFPNKKWLAMDAGVQIVGLMQNRTVQSTRPAWLTPYVGRRTLVLTSQSTVGATWHKHLESSVRGNNQLLTNVVKDGDLGDTHLRASAAFEHWVSIVISGERPC